MMSYFLPRNTDSHESQLVGNNAWFVFQHLLKIYSRLTRDLRPKGKGVNHVIPTQ